MRKLRINQESGFILPALVSIIIALGIISLAVADLVSTNLFSVTRNIQRQQAFNIAEAGVNYYLWHLSHNATDYKDGQTTPTTPDPQLGYGPYVHNYVDDNAKVTGTYTLWISPQGGNSTVVNVRSIGKINGSTSTRTVVAQIGAPSFASYAVVGDSALWFGPTETADGPVFSNAGIEMDGPNTDQVTSANTTYVPPIGLHSSNYANGASHPGVWCDTAVTSPVNCNTRSKSSWQYPAPSIDFASVTSSLCTMKKTAFASDPSTSSLANLANACSQTPTTRTAAYLPQRSSSGAYSVSKGYLIQLNNNNTYNLSQVNGETDTSSTYSTALTVSGIANSIPIPASGVIFAEDNVWVRSNPTFHGRVTIGAGRLAQASINAEIVITDNLKYSAKDGTDSIGLVSEDSIFMAPYAPPQSGSFNFEIDGALLAEAGSVEYYPTYRSNANSCTKGWVSPSQTFTFYGSVATRQTWTWTWLQGGSPCGNAAFQSGTGYISGIENNTTQYDYNLQYNPPPSYPVTSTYNVLSWREVLTKP